MALYKRSNIWWISISHCGKRVQQSAGTSDKVNANPPLFNQRVADSRVLNPLGSIMKAGCIAEGETLLTEQGVPQGGVISPLASNVLLTPFDREVRRKGYQSTRFSDDWW